MGAAALITRYEQRRLGAQDQKIATLTKPSAEFDRASMLAVNQLQLFDPDCHCFDADSKIIRK